MESKIHNDAAQMNILELAGQIDWLKNTLAQKEARLRQRNNRVASLEAAQSGLFWDLLVTYRRAKDCYLPPGTKRRILYDWGLNTIKFFFYERRNLLAHGSFLARHPIAALTKARRISLGDLVRDLERNRRFLERSPQRNLFALKFFPKPGTRKSCLIVSDCQGDTFRYRCEHQAEQLRFYGLTADTAMLSEVDCAAALKSYECFLLHRVRHTVAVEKLISRAERANKPVIFDTDDLVFDEQKISYIRAMEWRSPQEIAFFRQNIRRQYQTLSLCRFAIVTNESLCKAVQEMFPQIQCFVNPNTLSGRQLAQAEEALQIHRSVESEGTIQIAYFSGTRTHHWDFAQCAGALARVMKTYPNVRLMLVGDLDVEMEFARFGERVEHISPQPWTELPRLYRRVDINLAPLELNNPFTECKSNLKYFEAGIMGIPTVASDIAAFRRSITHGDNGYLCRTEEDWFRCLSRLATDSSFRKKMGSRARIHVLNNCTTRAGAHHLFAALSAIAESSGPRFKELFRGRKDSEGITIFKEHALAHELLDGFTGLEIGAAAHNPFGLRTRNVCHPEGYEFYADAQRCQMGVKSVPVDIWAAADNIPVPDSSEDFILSSHVVEHLPNVIAAFVEWNRIVRDSGYVFMIIPVKGALAEDSARELTSLSHFIEDYHRGRTLDTHSIEGVPGGRMGHYHTFTPDSVLGVVDWMRAQRLCSWHLVSRENIDTKVGNGFTLVFKVNHTNPCES
jgi:glycosyltransferase involved in cell wall biosynthesis